MLDMSTRDTSKSVAGWSRDMTAPNWARTHARLQRMIAELREHGCQVIEPAGFETAPELRPTGRPAPAATFREGTMEVQEAIRGRHPLL